jgi:hypothetical protein
MLPISASERPRGGELTGKPYRLLTEAAGEVDDRQVESVFLEDAELVADVDRDDRVRMVRILCRGRLLAALGIAIGSIIAGWTPSPGATLTVGKAAPKRRNEQFLACAAELARSLVTSPPGRLPTTSGMQVMREIERNLL